MTTLRATTLVPLLLLAACTSTPAGEVDRNGWLRPSPSLQQEIGLGAATAIAGVRVRWPSGEVQELGELELDACYAVREGEEPTPVPARSFAFGAPKGHDH